MQNGWHLFPFLLCTPHLYCLSQCCCPLYNHHHPFHVLFCIHCAWKHLSPLLLANGKQKKSRQKYVSCYPLSFTAYRKIVYFVLTTSTLSFFVFLSFPPLSSFDLSISSALPLFHLSPLLLFGVFSQKTKQQTKMENNW